jgi:predicted dehydrogenase
VRLVATCDLDVGKAEEFARRFGAGSHYGDFRRMIEREELDAVFISTGYGDDGRPTHARLAAECLEAGLHVWTEKPPAATCAEIERVQQAERDSGRRYMVGYKTMFFPANVKAKELAGREEFGTPRLITLQRPVSVPTPEQMDAYLNAGQPVGAVIGFLDHVCHVTSLLIHLAGMPQTLHYERAPGGAAAATFTFPDGLVATMALTHGCAYESGIERTMIVGEGGHDVIVQNNKRVLYRRGPARPDGWGYGNTPTHYTGPPEATTAVWEPECSLGQLYNKGLFMQGFYGELNEFARAILDGRRPARSHSAHALQTTQIFQAFAQGPAQTIQL